MPSIFLRIFILYKLLHSFLLCLVPKKLQKFLPSSWNLNESINASPNPPTHLEIQNPLTMNADELHRVFQMFDHNGDGRISKDELSQSLKKMGIMITDEEVIQMMEKIDVNEDGVVDMEEFGELYGTIMGEREEEEEEGMKEAFKVFDENDDGFITVEELKAVMAALGVKQGRSVEDCRRMIKKVDVDGDGMVNFLEFKRMMRGGGVAAFAA